MYVSYKCLKLLIALRNHWRCAPTKLEPASYGCLPIICLHIVFLIARMAFQSAGSRAAILDYLIVQ